VDANRPRYVFDRLLSHVLEAETEFVAHLIVHHARNHDVAWIGQRLQPSRHIDAVTEDIITVDYDVADVDADAKLDAPVCRNADIAFDHTALNVDSAAHGIDHTDELHQHPVAGRLDNTAPVLGDLGVDQFLAMRLELEQRAFLVDAHQPAVTGNVARPYGSQPTVHSFCRSYFRHVIVLNICGRLKPGASAVQIGSILRLPNAIGCQLLEAATSVGCHFLGSSRASNARYPVYGRYTHFLLMSLELSVAFGSLATILFYVLFIRLGFSETTGVDCCYALRAAMRRRDFITFLGGAAVGWSLTAHAQQSERMRRVGVLTGISGSDSETKVRMAAFSQELQRLGWIDGQNVRIDIRGGGGDVAQVRKYAAELVALAPDVILVIGSFVMTPLLEATRTVPIVFTVVVDPVGAGFVQNLSHPGGNVTGFMMFEYGLSAKWPELLKEIAPAVTRVAVFRDPTTIAGIGQFAVIEAVAPSLGMEVDAINSHNAREIEQAINAFSRTANGGLIVTAGPGSIGHRELIIALATRHKLPSVYIQRLFVKDGGLVSYGPNLVDQIRQSAVYIDRILKGEKPADLPVQAPNKYELAINLKTAKALGLQIPPALLMRADKVIE
jgi:putative ABC transport system substrate-binding protein